MKKTCPEFELTDMISKLFEERENEIYTRTHEEREMSYEKDMIYSDIHSAIDCIPTEFTEITKKIESSLEEYLSVVNSLQGEQNKKCYTKGFKDGANLILNCLSKDSKL